MKLRTLLTTFILIWASTTNAQTPSADLTNLLNGIRTMRANFTQTVSDNKGKIAQRSYGKMSLQRPGKFRWEVTRPIPQLIIANDTRLWIYDPDLEQVTIRALTKTAGETPALLLSKVDGSLDKTYNIKQTNANNMQWFTLIPRSADSTFANIQLGFVGNQIREMKLQDHLDHITRIQFENVSSNAVIATNTFVFRAPAKVDVIDETRKK